MNPHRSFVCIGAGNVATHLVRSLSDSGYKLVQVYSRTAGSARMLAHPRGASFTTVINEISRDADFYLLALPDQALPGFLNEFKSTDKLIFHTAGSTGLEIFGPGFIHSGVLYPLQTFSKEAELDLSEVPILVEGMDKETENRIEGIARSVSRNVYITDSGKRKWIHLAAVFACNFTNHMQVISEDLLRQENLDPGLLKPLIEETYRKSVRLGAANAQTGPASRGDIKTIEKHIIMLKDKSLLQKIYTFTSQSIQFTNSPSKNKPVS